MRAFALAAFLLAGCATQEPVSKTCFAPEWSWPAYKAKMERAAPGTTWIELTEAERDRLLYVMNVEIDRPTGIMYDRIGYFRKSGVRYVVMVFMVGDCVWADSFVFEAAVKTMARPRERGT